MNIGMDEVMMGFAILIGVFLVTLIFAAVAVSNRNRSNAQQPVRTEHAKILEKQPIQQGMICVQSWLTFELENGNRVRLAVQEKEGLVAGDQGTLTWQGTAFQSFKRH